MIKKISESRSAALNQFFAYNPQPAGGKESLTDTVKYGWGLSGQRVMWTRLGALESSAERLRDRISSPDSRAVPVPVGYLHIQTSYPSGDDFQSATLFYWPN